jgi:hypothetical protein
MRGPVRSGRMSDSGRAFRDDVDAKEESDVVLSLCKGAGGYVGRLSFLESLPS